MKKLAAFLEELEQARGRAATTGPAVTEELLLRYLSSLPDEEKAVAAGILSGRLPGRTGRLPLKDWALERAGIPGWLFEASRKMTNDTAETIALLLPGDGTDEEQPLGKWMEALTRLPGMQERERKAWVYRSWETLGSRERALLNKFLTGTFRAGVSLKQLAAALSRLSGLDDTLLSVRLVREEEACSPDILFRERQPFEEPSCPYSLVPTASMEASCGFSREETGLREPFPSGQELDRLLRERLGPPEDWLAEWQWEGIRAQVIFRRGELHVWTETGEPVTREFPELHGLAGTLPDGTVLDGELVLYGEGKFLSSGPLANRIGRRPLTGKRRAEHPVRFVARDCLEHRGKDIRQESFALRRQTLEQLQAAGGTEGFGSTAGGNALRSTGSPDFGAGGGSAGPGDGRGIGNFQLPPLIAFSQWAELAKERENARERMAEGILLRRKAFPQQSATGRLLWKATPMTAFGLLLYARKTGGGHAGYDTYSLGVWDGDLPVPVANVTASLCAAEREAVERFIAENSLERFGPVRTVRPELVFEIAFDAVAPSSRHKSGIVLKAPRILRWRKDKNAPDATRLRMLKALAV